MNLKFKKILFATDLSDNCRHAFSYAASLAAQYCGSITLLHVMESIPDSLDTSLKGLLGEEAWEMMHKKHEHTARSILIGKKSAAKSIHEALGIFSETAKNDECNYSVDNILVKDGDVVENILETSVEEECNIIVIGSNKTMFTDSTSLGHRAKSILKRSKIPVMMVPPVKV